MPNIRFERSAGEQQRYNGEEARPPCPARRSSDNRVLGVLGIVLNGPSVAAAGHPRGNGVDHRRLYLIPASL
ncbi:hypothetical protein MesoLj131b_44820 [Mesorhizobium sp. 131-2-5]|nr:hypothetical protein MesoLj131b_44820 [Mesorhizobium sp. 131-2-5]